ncbi:hypothetical protein VTN02DRAFT_1406 [Thermoascus thermophilus]
MSAESLATFAVTLFAGPGRSVHRHPFVNESISFRMVLDGTVQTLSTNNSPDGHSLKGLMFVPSLDPHDPCSNETAPFVPRNVTREADLPDLGYSYSTIGLAPWVSVDCTKAYLAAAGKASVGALIFFKPGHYDTGKPPPISSLTWSLDDGGAWKKNNEYPVYAIPGSAGATLMHELSRYSGNLNSTKNATEPAGYTRLYALINLERNDGTLPGLWIFILAILGSLLFIVISAAVAIRCMQRRRRDDLRRRILAGEVDLESLGIKRTNVPPQVLENIPLYTYPSLSTPPKAVLREDKTPSYGVLENDVESSAQASRSSSGSDFSSAIKEAEDVQETSSSAKETNQGKRLTFSQTTCAICLDDFVPGSSTVRELPCAHIFHPECIDNFLLQNSSLCPVCKKSVLPPDFCPDTVTNLMVRQEQLMRRLRRQTSNATAEEHRLPFISRLRRVRVPLPAAGSLVSFSDSSLVDLHNPSARDQMIATSSPLVQQSVMSDEQNPSVDPARDDAVVGSGRERMQRSQALEYEEREPSENMPKWRRVLIKFFSGR